MAHSPLKLTCASAFLIAALSSTAVLAQEAPAAKPQQNLPAIVVTKASVRHLVDRVIATGTIKPVEEISIQPLVDGLAVKNLNVDVGDVVKADDTLATLNEDALVLQKSQSIANKAKAEASLAQYRAQLVEAQANAEQAKSQYDRAVNMAEKGTTSTATLEQAKATNASAIAKVNSAQQAIEVAQADIKVVDSQIADTDLKLARTAVKAPTAGTISAKNAMIGAIASGSGQPLFTLIRDSAIELVAEVSENDIIKVKPGQKATISLAGNAAKLSGSVRLVSPTVDAVSRLGLVKISIDDNSKAVAGMYGSAEIVIAETDDVALPLSAVTTSRGGSTARKVDNGVVKQAKITIGIQDGGFVEITDGLKEGDVVVAKAGAFVRDGDKITPVTENESAQSN